MRKKSAVKVDPLKLEFKEIKADLKKLKKSKKKMQFQWYRTKREHTASIKDLDLRLKALKGKIGRKKAAPKRTTQKAK